MSVSYMASQIKTAPSNNVQGEPVHVRVLPGGASGALRRRTADLLLELQTLRHDNVNPFIGMHPAASPAITIDLLFRFSMIAR